MILAVWRGLGATAPLVAEMAVTVQPSRAATSCKGASWFDWPRSLVLTRTYSAARLVALARPTIPITGYGHGGSVPSDQQQPSPSPAMIRLLSYQNRSHRRQALRSSRRIAPEAGTNPRPSGNHSAHGHDRLKHAVARATHLQGLYDRAAAVVVRR